MNNIKVNYKDNIISSIDGEHYFLEYYKNEDLFKLRPSRGIREIITIHKNNIDDLISLLYKYKEIYE